MANPLTPEALRVFVSAWLATSSPRRIRQMREAVELTFARTAEQAKDIPREMRTPHEEVLVVLLRAERKAERRRRARKVIGYP